MCFNATATWATAGLGIACSIYIRSKGKPFSFYSLPAYVAIMEILQGLMYIELRYPSHLFSLTLIYIAYLHLAFQPLAVNYWLGSFITQDKKRLYNFTLKLCVVGGLLILSRLLISDISPLCMPDVEAMCGITPKIYFGNLHIAWALPLRAPGWYYFTPSIALHAFLVFVPGILLGLPRLMLILFLLGPVASHLMTPDTSEGAAIWCLTVQWVLFVTMWELVFGKLPIR